MTTTLDFHDRLLAFLQIRYATAKRALQIREEETVNLQYVSFKIRITFAVRCVRLIIKGNELFNGNCTV